MSLSQDHKHPNAALNGTQVEVTLSALLLLLAPHHAFPPFPRLPTHPPNVQVADPADADSFYFDPLDCTKVGYTPES